MLLFVLTPKPFVGNIITFFHSVFESRTDISDISWIISNADLFIVPFVVWLGAIYPDFDFIWWLRKWHRKLFHNIFAVTLPASIIILIFTVYNRSYHGLLVAGAFSLGCFVHILSDSITPTGTYVLWPLAKKFKLGIPLITTGSKAETLMMLLASGLFILYVYFAYLQPLS
jgi:membrane-bound metal-dependent hydrolase YbcI (DUF457 family)